MRGDIPMLQTAIRPFLVRQAAGKSRKDTAQIPAETISPKAMCAVFACSALPSRR